jgi:Flp pilus assembly protein TadB
MRAFADPETVTLAEPVRMTATKRKVVTRLLILAANLATIAVIVKVATVSPIRAGVIVLACVLVLLFTQRRVVARLVHRFSGR